MAKYIVKDLFEGTPLGGSVTLQEILDKCKEKGVDISEIGIEADYDDEDGIGVHPYLSISYVVENPRYEEELKEEKQRAKKYKNYQKELNEFEKELRKKHGLV